ncbi:hypothetical protein DDZ14_13475 [Maritimibacter sp. 55A14]|uniref:hypothetical protein n=1 Tax=Maritimibacter sp. 55A14 TaxID=2174844 RepID=UPI000D61820B|nr:hypothetical protein [Maritimibacter sp. 55A14]PWE31364.1 hypothetical protein DDZ14_13475 [Maritimibacter sp. 55A14]
MLNALMPGYPDPELREQLHTIVDEMLLPFGKTSPRHGFSLLAGPQPFDSSKPNMHDTKAEFSRELALVSKNLKRIDAIVDSLVGDESDAEMAAAAKRLTAVIDAKMKVNAQNLSVAKTRDLIRKNVADCGGCVGSLFILLDFRQALASRLEELNEQRERFWSIRHRAPDYYARAIANRLAKLYARETGQRPTVGAHPDTGQPSTGFTRALQQVFALLEISSDVRSPAKWAVDNLKDEDLGEPHNALAAMFEEGNQPKSTREEIVELLAKRPEQ